MPRIKWAEKAKRIVKNCQECPDEIEHILEKTDDHATTLNLKYFGHRARFTLKENEIDVEVLLR